MPRREVDTSRAKCDTCGKLYQPGDGIYSAATKYADEPEDGKDVIVSFRHIECHVPIEKRLDNVRASIKSIEGQLDALKRKP